MLQRSQWYDDETGVPHEMSFDNSRRSPLTTVTVTLHYSFVLLLI